MVSSSGSVEKLSAGSVFSKLFASINDCNESDNPRNESGSMQVIWFPLKSLLEQRIKNISRN